MDYKMTKHMLNSYTLKESRTWLLVCTRHCYFIPFNHEHPVHMYNVHRFACMYTRLQTVWSLPGHSRQANKGHSPRCHRRPNGPGRLADKVVQPTTQSAEGCTLYIHANPQQSASTQLPFELVSSPGTVSGTCSPTQAGISYKKRRIEDLGNDTGPNLVGCGGRICF